MIDANRRSKLLAEARPLLQTHTRCRELWHALQQADFKQTGRLDDNAVQLLWDRKQKILQELLLVDSVEAMKDLIDEDEDGYWNEDEQILLFSIIKERLQNLAQDLCNIFEYGLYKQMMGVVRMIETDIVKYQEILRKRTHEKELKAYADIGQEKLRAFNKEWEMVFARFQAEKEAKMREVEQRHLLEQEQLNAALEKDIHFTKIKPKARMRDLASEEKLYAINERYGEAQTIRNELKQLEAEEQTRVQNKIIQELENKRRTLLIRQQKEIRQMQQKNQTAHNNYRIKMESEFTRLKKEIKLYYNDITKNQNLASRLAIRAGKTKDELRRTKLKARQMNAQIKEGRTRRRSMISSGSEGFFGSSGSMQGTQLSTIRAAPGAGQTTYISTVMSKNRTLSPLRVNSKSVIRFSIKSDIAGLDRPVNLEPEYSKSTALSSRAGKLLDRKINKQEALPSLTSLYNEKLELSAP